MLYNLLIKYALSVTRETRSLNHYLKFILKEISSNLPLVGCAVSYGC